MKKSSNSQKNVQNQREEQSGYSEILKDGSVSPQETTPSSTTSHLTCSDVMMVTFRKAYCKEDFTELFKLMGDEEDKNFRWLVLLEEFGYLMRSEDEDHMLGVFAQMQALKSQIDFVSHACYYIEECHFIGKELDKEVIDKLCELYPNDYTNPKSATLTRTMLGTKEYEYEILSDEYSRLSDKGSGEKMTEEQWNKMVSAVSKNVGYKINQNTTSIAEFTSDYQNFLTEIKSRNG